VSRKLFIGNGSINLIPHISFLFFLWTTLTTTSEWIPIKNASTNGAQFLQSRYFFARPGLADNTQTTVFQIEGPTLQRRLTARQQAHSRSSFFNNFPQLSFPHDSQLFFFFFDRLATNAENSLQTEAKFVFSLKLVKCKIRTHQFPSHNRKFFFFLQASFSTVKALCSPCRQNYSKTLLLFGE